MCSCHINITQKSHDREIWTASFENMVKFKYLGITNQTCMHAEIKIRLSPAIPAIIQSCMHTKI